MPIVALVIAASLFVRTCLLVGPLIDIEFASADGLEANKTEVRYKEVVVGRVEAVSLRGDRKRVIATVRLQRSAENLAVEDTLFWVVRPRIGAGGISGLGTLLSGAYIAVDAGVSEKARTSFVGLEVPPFVLRGEPGSIFVLRAEDLGSLEVGSPVYYRRTRVGRVVGYALDPASDELSIRVFVEAPYHTLVTKQARFWNASGIDLSAERERPHGQHAEPRLGPRRRHRVRAAARHPEDAAGPGRARSFVLFDDRHAALAPEDGVPVPVRMIFDQSVRGLAENAPIDFLGVEIGRVRDVALQLRGARQPLRGARRGRDLSAAAGLHPQRPLLGCRGRPGRRGGGAAAPRRAGAARAAAHRQPAHGAALRRARLRAEGRPSDAGAGRRSARPADHPGHLQRSAAADRGHRGAPQQGAVRRDRARRDDHPGQRQRDAFERRQDARRAPTRPSAS